ncbi:hypothetical protein, partial [Aeromonas jandaei]
SFGTQLMSSNGELLAMADPHGRALALLTEQEGELVIKDDKGQCRVPYHIKDKPPQGQSYQQYKLQCGQ